MTGIDSRDEPVSCAAARGRCDAHASNDAVRRAFDAAASSGLCLLDARGNVLASNPVGKQWLDVSGNELLLQDAVRRTLAGDSAMEACSKLGHEVQFDRLDGLSGSFVLVTVRQAQSHSPTVLDALTQLPDRRALIARADAWRRAAAPALARFAALFLDLDEFKVVNDRHGHAIGDAVLRTLAARWQHCIRDGDLLARYGGDEFVLLLQNATTAAEVEPVMRRLREATSAPISLGELTLHVSATIGWASSVDSVGELDATIAAADRDMYASKGRVIS